MRIDDMRCTCLKCQHVFDAEIVADAPLKLTVLSIKIIRCPKCGARDRSIGLGGRLEGTPGLDRTLGDRVQWWHAHGEHGESSATIFYAITGTRLQIGRSGLFYNRNVPRDPDDFRRCHDLLELIPEFRVAFGALGVQLPEWAPFVERLSEMERVYAEERPSGICIQLNRLLQEALAESSTLKLGPA